MTERRSAIKSIRAFCTECTCGDMEWIRECPSTHCALWHYRMGKNPNISDETKEKRRRVAQVRGFGSKAEPKEVGA